jgi:colanic acid biosynthesis glycosyl transferase WcaI
VVRACAPSACVLFSTPVKTLLLNQYFHPDLSATAQIATDLANDLAASGVEVSALASRGNYLGGPALPRRERYSGVEVVRTSATSFGKRTLLHRATDYASFYVTASAALARLPRHDVIIALTTPPLIAAAGLIGKALKGSKVVYWVQDLYPEVALALGALESGSIARMMSAMSRTAMRRSDCVVTLGDAMRDRCIASGAAPERTVVIPNWSDADAIRPVQPHDNPLRNELAQGARTLVMYSGNMGRGHDVPTLLEAARRLRERADIAFVFIGDGAKRVDVEVAARELPNVRLVPYQPRDQLAFSLSAGDLHLIALSPELEGLMEPSKLYGIMAAGRPALFVGPSRSEVAATIVRERCGRVHANGDAAGLAASIAELADDNLQRRAMGERARAALVARYSRRVATSRFRSVLESLGTSVAPGALLES